MEFGWNASLVSHEWYLQDTRIGVEERRPIRLINSSFNGYVYIFNTSLQFLSLRVEDAGVYTCNATILLTYPDGPNNTTATISNSSSTVLNIQGKLCIVENSPDY